MTDVFIVIGCAGEYSDRMEWAVKVFTDKKMAMREVEHLTLKSKEFYARYEEYKYASIDEPGSTKKYLNWVRRNNPVFDEMKKYDPRFEQNYTGTEYFLWTAPIA